MAEEIARRLVNGRWVTNSENESDGNSGSTPGATTCTVYTIALADFGAPDTGTAEAAVVTVPAGHIVVRAGIKVTQAFNDSGVPTFTGLVAGAAITQVTDTQFLPTVVAHTDGALPVAAADLTPGFGAGPFNALESDGTLQIVVAGGAISGSGTWEDDGTTGAMLVYVWTCTPAAA